MVVRLDYRKTKVTYLRGRHLFKNLQRGKIGIRYSIGEISRVKASDLNRTIQVIRVGYFFLGKRRIVPMPKT